MERHLFKNIQAIFSRYRSRFSKAVILVLLSNGMLILNPLIFRQALMQMEEKKLSQDETGLLQALMGPYTDQIAAWVILLLTISFLSALFKYLMRITFISISRDAERQLRSELFEKIQMQSMSFYDRHGIGELLSRLTNDISSYRDVLGPGIMYPIFFLTLVIPGLFALFYISPQLAAISLVPLVAIPLINSGLRHRVYTFSRGVQQGLADLSNMAQEHYSGERMIKGYAAESSFTHCFKRLSKSLISLNIKSECSQGLLFPFFSMLTKMITVILVLSSGFIIFKAKKSLTTADFVSFMWIQSYIFFPVLMMAWVLPLYAKGRAAYDRLFEIYNEPLEVEGALNSCLYIDPLADIEFKDLTFSYPSAAKPVLKNFSLKIKGGSFIGITGPVGSGKTTLFRLLNREYEVAPGKIFIGEKDIRDYPLEAFSKEIAMVEQIPFLFSRSIADNVSFGNEEATQREIESVAQAADLHDTIISFPDQYSTMVGERGVTLSGGQKQRLAIARALLVKRSILLLDDVFSAVDTDTEKRIFKALREKFSQKTILLVTHRASVLSQTSRILFMSGGQIVEDGAPEELLERKGHYAALVELQRLHL